MDNVDCTLGAGRLKAGLRTNRLLDTHLIVGPTRGSAGCSHVIESSDGGETIYMHEVPVEKSAIVSLPDLIDSAVNGDEVIFTQNDLPVAKLVALPQHKQRPHFGSAKGMFVMAPDFSEPLEDFDEYR